MGNKMDDKSAHFLQAVVGAMLVARPIEGEYSVIQRQDGYHVESDEYDFWDEPLAYEHEARIVASLLNLGFYSVMDMCNIFDAVQAGRPDLYPEPEPVKPKRQRRSKATVKAEAARMG